MCLAKYIYLKYYSYNEKEKNPTEEKIFYILLFSFSEPEVEKDQESSVSIYSTIILLSTALSAIMKFIFKHNQYRCRKPWPITKHHIIHFRSTHVLYNSWERLIVSHFIMMIIMINLPFFKSWFNMIFFCESLLKNCFITFWRLYKEFTNLLIKQRLLW